MNRSSSKDHSLGVLNRIVYARTSLTISLQTAVDGMTSLLLLSHSDRRAVVLDAVQSNLTFPLFMHVLFRPCDTPPHGDDGEPCVDGRRRRAGGRAGLN